MCGFDGRGNLPYDLSGSRYINSFRCNCRAQAHAFDKLHHQIQFPVGRLAHIEYTHDTGMIDAGQGLKFLSEAAADQPGSRLPNRIFTTTRLDAISLSNAR